MELFHLCQKFNEFKVFVFYRDINSFPFLRQCFQIIPALLNCLLNCLFVLEQNRSSLQRCCIITGALGNFANSQENTCARVSFLVKLQAKTCNIVEKKTLAQVFSCEFCEISQNTFLHRAKTSDKRYSTLLLFGLRKGLESSILETKSHFKITSNFSSWIW